MIDGINNIANEYNLSRRDLLGNGILAGLAIAAGAFGGDILKPKSGTAEKDSKAEQRNPKSVRKGAIDSSAPFYEDNFDC